MLLLLFGTSLLGAEPTRVQLPGYVADVGYDDQIIQRHVVNLLLARGIKARLAGGTLGIYVEVPPGSEAKAIPILRQDATKRRYFVQFGTDDLIEAEKPKKLLSHVPFKAVLKQPAFSRRTPLGRFLRRRDIYKYATQFPTIDSLEITERRYLATPHTLRTAYKVNITLRSTQYKPGEQTIFVLETFCIRPDGSNLIKRVPL